ncbi:uncharacterized protein GIQ15_06047 [Arthroderma uncinatum]|uniref:uncharacterized protein n=1 Tax=Arthroderma uncinatum TaxID=74035 RepID=UPI00144ACF7E|nr:uncharacterized protein GIQ15_06047 [Arthroderma uncinatum]KAF3480700.1 hypothetical protein GIQ15_06047 [Arthroderma uncinatum]
MPIISQTPNMAPTDEDEAAAECDEPPGYRARGTAVHQHPPTSNNNVNSKLKPNKESLLTRALLSSPELSPTDRPASSTITWRSVPAFSINSNHSGPSTAELTSDGELTTPPRSTTPSPPPPTQFTRPPWLGAEPASKPVSPVDEHELKLEANLGRKRCITFACASKVDAIEHTQSDPVAREPPKRKSTIKFACPARPRDIDVDVKNDRHTPRRPSAGIRGSRSPAPRCLQSRHQARSLQLSQTPVSTPIGPADGTTGSLKVTGLGKFELSDATRFQEFGSSLEDEDWLNESSDYKQKMTLADSTSHSDTAMPPPMKWRDSHNSIESLTSPGPFEEVTPKPKRAVTKEKKPKSTAPSLPDSTDFVCGTIDEDRSIEVAYISHMEERRRQKHIPIPQDIDPSFPTSDPEDEDDEDADEDDVSAKPTAPRKQQASDVDAHVEPPRGRRSSRTNIDKAPNAAPHSPRRLFGHSPRRLRSPPPPGRLRSPPPSRRTSLIHPPNMTGAGPSAKMITIALAERPNRTRTSSLPRTPNPFFARAYTSHSIYKRTSRSPSPSPCPKSSTKSKPNPTHTRGPIDIVAGLEKKRQKRKEKFWRQHCRRAAKEQNLNRDKIVPGRGAERMKELGLEVAERFRAYGVGMGVGMGGNGPKLVLSI